jgi:hypothetical protein
MELNQLLWTAALAPALVDEALGAAPVRELAEIRRLQMVVEALVALAAETGLSREEIAEWLRQTLPAEAATLARQAATAPAAPSMISATIAATIPARAAAVAAPVARAASPAPSAEVARPVADAPAQSRDIDYFDSIFRAAPVAAVAVDVPMTTCAGCGAPVPAGRTNITASGEVCDGCYSRMG